jgi:hypothetical protein
MTDTYEFGKHILPTLTTCTKKDLIDLLMENEDFLETIAIEKTGLNKDCISNLKTSLE